MIRAPGCSAADAFGRDLARAIDDANERGVGFSVARFSFEEAVDLRTSMDAARLVSRLVRSADFACRQDDGSIVAVFAGTDLRAAHVVARRLASVIKHTLLGPDAGARSGQANVTLATLKPGDTPITLMARDRVADGCRGVIRGLILAGQTSEARHADQPSRSRHDRCRIRRGLPLVLHRKTQA